MSDLRNAAEEILEYIEDNYVCDEQAICLEGENNATIDPSRSEEFKDLIKRLKLALDEEE